MNDNSPETTEAMLSTETPPRKQLHEYRQRNPTEEELAIVSQLVAEGASVNAVAKATNSGSNRAARLMNLAEVQIRAIKLRETEVFPQLLKSLVDGLMVQKELLVDLSKQVNRLETSQRLVAKQLRVAKMRERTHREQIRDLKGDAKALRDAMRKRGLTPPV
jgi:hypothetical protein